MRAGTTHYLSFLAGVALAGVSSCSHAPSTCKNPTNAEGMILIDGQPDGLISCDGSPKFDFVKIFTERGEIEIQANGVATLTDNSPSTKTTVLMGCVTATLTPQLESGCLQQLSGTAEFSCFNTQPKVTGTITFSCYAL